MYEQPGKKEAPASIGKSSVSQNTVLEELHGKCTWSVTITADLAAAAPTPPKCSIQVPWNIARSIPNVSWSIALVYGAGTNAAVTVAFDVAEAKANNSLCGQLPLLC